MDHRLGWSTPVAGIDKTVSVTRQFPQRKETPEDRQEPVIQLVLGGLHLHIVRDSCPSFGPFHVDMVIKEN